MPGSIIFLNDGKIQQMWYFFLVCFVVAFGFVHLFICFPPANANFLFTGKISQRSVEDNRFVDDFFIFFLTVLLDITLDTQFHSFHVSFKKSLFLWQNITHCRIIN